MFVIPQDGAQPFDKVNGSRLDTWIMTIIRGLFLILRLFFTCGLIIASAIIAIVSGFAGLAGLGASRDQCPYGADCSDAIGVMRLSLIVTPISCLIFVMAL